MDLLIYPIEPTRVTRSTSISDVKSFHVNVTPLHTGALFLSVSQEFGTHFRQR